MTHLEIEIKRLKTEMLEMFELHHKFNKSHSDLEPVGTISDGIIESLDKVINNSSLVICPIIETCASVVFSGEFFVILCAVPLSQRLRIKLESVLPSRP